MEEAGQVTLCDSDVMIELFRKNPKTIAEFEKLGWENAEVSAITVMELLVGARNKEELRKIKRELREIAVVEIDSAVSRKAVELIEEYALSHGLRIQDAIIAASAIVRGIELFTYNTKDFRFIEGIKLYKPSE